MTIEKSPLPFAGSKASLGFVIVLAGLTAFAPLSIDIYLPGLPMMARELAAPSWASTMTVSIFYAGLCIGQLFYGPISDRVGRRGPLLAGIGLYVAASLGSVAAGSIWWLIAMRLLQALGGCAGPVISRAIVRDRFSPAESAHVFSTLLLVLSIAPIVAPLLGSALLLVAGWRIIFAVLAAFGALVGIAALFRLDETLTEETAVHARGESPFRSYRVLLREPAVMRYVIAGGLSHCGLLTYLAIAPDVLINGFHLSPQLFGWTIAANGIGLVSANALNRRLLRRHDYVAILGVANLVSVAASILLMFDAVTGAAGLWGMLVPLFVVVASMGFTQPNALAAAMAHDRLRAGTTSALFGCLQFGMGALGATIAGLLHDGTARPMGAVILIAYLLAAIVLRIPLRRT